MDAASTAEGGNGQQVLGQVQNAAPRPMVTPQMQQIAAQVQQLNSQIPAAGGHTTPAGQQIVASIQRLRQQYQHLQRAAQISSAGTTAQNPAQSSSLAAIFGAPPAGASPQQQAQWAEQQARVQQLLRAMNELKTKIEALNEELANTQLAHDEKVQRQASLNQAVARFRQYQQVLLSAGKAVRNAQASIGGGAVAVTTPTAAGGVSTNGNSLGNGTIAGSEGGTNSPGGGAPIPRPSSTTIGAPIPQANTGIQVRAPVPYSVPAGRPTLPNGQPSFPTLCSPALAKPPTSSLPTDPSSRLLSKRNLSSLLASVDPLEKLDPDVEEILLDVADEFIESVIGFSCKLAKHRKSDQLGTQDLKMTLEKEWNIRVMGGYDTDTRKRTVKEGTREFKGKIQAVANARALA